MQRYRYIVSKPTQNVNDSRGISLFFAGREVCFRAQAVLRKGVELRACSFLKKQAESGGTQIKNRPGFLVCACDRLSYDRRSGLTNFVLRLRLGGERRFVREAGQSSRDVFGGAARGPAFPAGRPGWLLRRARQMYSFICKETASYPLRLARNIAGGIAPVALAKAR